MIFSVLVIEDELSTRSVLRTSLGRKGYRVLEASSAEEGLSAFAARAPQAVLLDLGLPDGSSFEVVNRIRETSEVPIVVITEETEEHDQLRALDGGASDYVTRPLRERELFARLEAAVRRAARAARGAHTITLGALRIVRLERRVFLGEREIELTTTEFDVLVALARKPGRVMSHRQLLRRSRGEHVNAVQSLRVFVRHLRQKLERDPAHPELLLTVPGLGYRLQPPT